MCMRVCVCVFFQFLFESAILAVCLFSARARQTQFSSALPSSSDDQCMRSNLSLARAYTITMFLYLCVEFFNRMGLNQAEQSAQLDEPTTSERHTFAAFSVLASHTFDRMVFFLLFLFFTLCAFCVLCSAFSLLRYLCKSLLYVLVIVLVLVCCFCRRATAQPVLTVQAMTTTTTIIIIIIKIRKEVV